LSRTVCRRAKVGENTSPVRRNRGFDIDGILSTEPLPERGVAGRDGAAMTELSGGAFPAARPGLVVQRDHARLHHDGSTYRLAHWRLLHNGTTRPVSRYLMRVEVDRYPGDPKKSRRHHRGRRLTLDELDVSAWSAGVTGGTTASAIPPTGSPAWEPMEVRLPPKSVRPAAIELWLQFGNDHRGFRLYPGGWAWIHYTYQVSAEQWGRWFQRAVRHATGTMSVELDFPAELEPDCWGVAESLDGEMPLPTEIVREESAGRAVFRWSTSSLSDLPQVGDRYRLEWHFRRGVPEENGEAPPSRAMQRIGIVQRGNPLLTAAAREFDLPLERADATRLLASLRHAAERARSNHNFEGGLGISAPQIGIGRAATVVLPPEGGSYVGMLNPRILARSDTATRDWEGCLSFFDIRGEVSRPDWLLIEHQHLDGATEQVRLEGRIARIVSHELDHLSGRLFDTITGARLQPVETYRELKAAGLLHQPGRTKRP
jgi:peptide deformylase